MLVTVCISSCRDNVQSLNLRLFVNVGPTKWAWRRAGPKLWVTMTWNCRFWHAFQRNVHGEKMGLTGCQFSGQWIGIRLDPVPLPALGNSVSFWLGNIFSPFSLAFSQRDYSSYSPLNFAFQTLQSKRCLKAFKGSRSYGMRYCLPLWWNNNQQGAWPTWELKGKRLLCCTVPSLYISEEGQEQRTSTVSSGKPS